MGADERLAVGRQRQLAQAPTLLWSTTSTEVFIQQRRCRPSALPVPWLAVRFGTCATSQLSAYSKPKPFVAVQRTIALRFIHDCLPWTDTFQCIQVHIHRICWCTSLVCSSSYRWERMIMYYTLSTRKATRSIITNIAATIHTGRIVLQYQKQQSRDSLRTGFAGQRFKRNSSANQSTSENGLKPIFVTSSFFMLSFTSFTEE